MKNQYFADKRDLFKYDLIEKLCQEIELETAFFILMLTKNDDSNEGNLINYEKSIGSKNTKLIEFLTINRNTDKKKRFVNVITRYYESIDIKIKLFEASFKNTTRNKYFNDISKEISNKSGLFFFDPDNGLEVQNNKDKHIRYIELKKIFNQINKKSIIVIYQHSPRATKKEQWKEHLNDKINELSILFDNKVYFIAEKEIAFFVIGRNYELNEKIETILKSYRKEYKDLLF